MRFLFIAPGEMAIPPKSGWGALERVVWHYARELRKHGHDVEIFNDPDPFQCLDLYRSFKPDVIHIHLGRHWELMRLLRAPVKIFTNHGGNFEECKPFFEQTVSNFLGDCSMFVLTTWERDCYKSLGFSDIEIVPNGVDVSEFSLSEERVNESIYLAKISKIKRQAELQKLGIDARFVGPVADAEFDTTDKNYLGVWTEADVRLRLGKYANLVLLSSLELQPLVCLEAMSAGLGLVLSEKACQNLDTSLPWIDVIDTSKGLDIKLINETIRKNREVSLTMRDEIVSYASTMSWDKIISEHYLPYVLERAL